MISQFQYTNPSSESSSEQVYHFPPSLNMQLLSIFTSMFLVSAVVSSPTGGLEAIEARANNRGSETISGLGARKQALVKAGGNSRDLAIAMLET